MLDLITTKELCVLVARLAKRRRPLSPRNLLDIASRRRVRPARKIGNLSLWRRSVASRLIPAKRGWPKGVPRKKKPPAK